ncbi:MAG: Hint domain-containing protein [Pseudomonadota bacterium]
MPTVTLTANDDVLNFAGDANDGLVDTIVALGGNDTIVGNNDDDVIYGGDGADSLSTGQGVNQIFAGDGDDVINNFFTAADGGPATGGSLVDTLDGGLGNDSIIGSQGDDVIYGGDGADTINSNFGVLFDALGLATGGDTVYGGAGDDVITTDGPGSTSSVRDTVYGGAGNDSIVGAIDAANPVRDLDSLFGGIGNDTIDGNGGEDSIDAGDGNDLVIARDQVDTTTGGAGIDTIDFTNESGSVVFDMGSGATNADGDVEENTFYENAIGSAFADTITGSTANASITAQESNNFIDGGLGADSLIGGGGSDTFVSGGGNDSIAGSEDAGDTDIDVLDYSDEVADITVTYTGDEAGIVTGVSTGTDTFVEIERIIFTDDDDNVNAVADTVGVTLDTQGGADFVRAGQGSDSLDGGEGVDRLSYIDSTSPVTIDIESGTVSGAGTGNDTFANFEEFTLTTGDDVATGSSGNDSIDANAGNDSVDAGAGDDTVIAGEGNDTVAGGAGADSLNGGIGFDILDYSDSATPVVVSLAAQVVAGGDAQGDTIFSFEGVVGTDGGDNLAGGANGEFFDGGGGDDAISAGGGDDTAIGGAGNDAIDAGSGNDTTDAGIGNDSVQAGAGNDTHDGGDGNDTIGVDDATGPVVIDLANDTLTGDGVGNDTILNFENATGSDNGDTIIGDGDSNTLDGGAGNDTLTGGGGDDSLVGGEGADTLDGGAGNDSLDGGLGDDDIIVGSGDTALGGGGDDEFFVNGASLTPGSNITITGGETDEEDVIDDTNNPVTEPPFAPLATGDEIQITGLNGGSFVNVPDAPGAESGQVFILDSGGNTISTINYSEIEAITCFTRGTMITTPDGEVAIEDLVEGDMVMTRDGGAQAIRWIGSQSVEAKGKLAPIMIREGALGNDRDLLVSPLHRMLIEDWRAELMFGETEVLAAAKHLVNGDTIHVQEGGEVEYFHMLFDSHEIVTANGASSESFHPGEQGIGWMAEEVREEIFEIFPQLRVEIEGYGPAARTSLKAWEVRALKR